MEMIIYQSRRFRRYEMEDVFEEGKFIKIPEMLFDEFVVGFRDQFDMKYIEGGHEFINKHGGSRFRRYYK